MSGLRQLRVGAPAGPGKAAFCPRCMRQIRRCLTPPTPTSGPIRSPNGRRPSPTPRGNRPRHRVRGGPPSPARNAYRIAIYAMFALVAFLIALVGAVLAARWAPATRLAQPSRVNAGPSSHSSIGAIASSTGGRLGPQRPPGGGQGKRLVALGPAAVATALDRFTSAGGDGDLPSISQPIVHALAEVGPAAADALGQALGSAQGPS